MTRNTILVIFLFLFGVIIGFLLGGTLVYHQYEDIIKGREMNGRIDRLLRRTEDLIYLNHKEPALVANSSKGLKGERKTLTKADSLLANDEQLNELLYNLEKNQSDSVLTDSLLRIVPEGSNEEIIIKKDVLIDSRMVSIIGFDLKKAKRNQTLDSLLTDDVITKTESGTIMVEFWESPLNYKGYKMNKSKLILFGLSPTSGFAIKKFNNNMYLEYDKRYYLIIYTNEFLSYQLVTNELLIKQLRI